MRGLLLVQIFIGFTLGAVAQGRPEIQKRELDRIAVDQRIKETQSFDRAMALAAQKGWSTTITDGKGNVARLVGVDEKGFPMYVETQNNVVAAQTIGTNKLWTGSFNLTGSNPALTNKMAMWDGGRINASHIEYIGRTTQKDNPSGTTTDGHATHVAGTLIASGVNPNAKGMANGLKGMLIYDFNNHIGEISNEAAGLLVSNHSYGSISGWRFNSGQSRWEFWGAAGQNEDWKFGAYTSEAQMWDSIMWLSPNYLMVKSSGNNRNESGPAVGATYYRFNESNQMAEAGGRPSEISSQTGYDLLPTYSTTKNSLIVGNVFPIAGGYTSFSDVALSNSSSVGPTDDGRIKPDVVSNGVGLLSTGADNNTSYAVLSGTSMAGPGIAGSALLLQEYFMRLNNDQAAWSSTIKGLIIHTTDPTKATPGPNYETGWGLANFFRAASVMNAGASKEIQQRTLKNDSVYSVTVVASGSGNLKATLCWTDPAGDASPSGTLNSRTKRLVNDLDLRIKKGTRTYFPWKLDPSRPADAATKGDNDLDNVEQIEIDSVLLGETYTIEVRHKGKFLRGDTTQRYSLIITGIGGTAYAGSAPTQAEGSFIDSLSFGGIAKKQLDTCKTYSDNRVQTANIEPGGNSTLYLKMKSCDNSNATRFTKVFVDLNRDGDFLDAGELLASSGGLLNGETFSPTLAFPKTLSMGDKLLMRIVVSETASIDNIQPTGTYTRGETQDYTLLVVRPSNDLSISSVVYPLDGECADPKQYVTVALRNAGSKQQNNIPLTTDVLENNVKIATLTGVFNGTLASGASTQYTFQTPFAMQAGKQYTFNTRTNLVNDQNSDNDQITSFASSTNAGGAPTNLQALVCNNSAVLFKGNAGITVDDYVSWFSTDTAKVPFLTVASNKVANSTLITSDKKYWASANDLVGPIGPADKTAYASGGYNEFNGNFVRFTNKVPMVIESVKMYVGNPGKVRIIYGDLASENGTGGYSYYNYDQRDFIVSNTRPTATPGAVTENDPNDKGAVFNLNFGVFTPGNHVLIMQATEGATIYRNNNIGTSPYPQKIGGVNDAFTITGNSVVPSSADPASFWYFFYDMKTEIVANSCPGPRTSITAVANVIPVVTKVGDSLVSSVATGNQWQKDGFDIQGAKGQSYKPTEPGNYRTVVVDALGCESVSQPLAVTVTAVINIDPVEIGFTAAPNPSNGTFKVRFRVDGKEDLGITVLNATGAEVYRQSQKNFSGEYNGEIRLQQPKPGVYLLRINHGMKQYLRRVMVL